jgi:predicted extracellular nuclease
MQVTVSGVVTGSFQGPNAVGIQGFFLQTPDASVDSSAATSEGTWDVCV